MKKLKYIFILLSIIILIVAVGIWKSGIFTKKPGSNISKKDEWTIKEVQINENNNTEMAITPKWDEMSISQQFMEVEYNNVKYSSKITKISRDQILGNIGNSIVNGYDVYNKITHNKKVELYSIKDLSDKCAIAVKFEEDNDYYVYINPYYKPATLGELVKDLSLREISSFGTIYYNYFEKDTNEYKNIEFYDVEDEIIWNMLFDNLNLENIYKDNEWMNYTSERFAQSIGIGIDIPLLGNRNISISLTDKGYLLINILDTGKGFYIGENKVQEFLNYIKDNYEGYQIIYTDKNNQKVESEINNNKDEIMMIQNKTNTQ